MTVSFQRNGFISWPLQLIRALHYNREKKPRLTTLSGGFFLVVMYGTTYLGLTICTIKTRKSVRMLRMEKLF